MRVLCLLFLVVFVAAAGIFAYQNQQELVLRFFDRTLEANVALVVAAAYVLGMLSGWTVVGMLRRSVNNVVSGLERQQQARAGW